MKIKKINLGFNTYKKISYNKFYFKLITSNSTLKKVLFFKVKKILA